ncbi:MAG: hypothetical protein Q9179_002633 [Wetmoreana sp. 5 TL-2023]
MAYKSRREPAKISTFSLIVTNLSITAALLVFALGFFPYKTFLPGYASFTADQAELAQQAPFDKLIFMVVDALRRLEIILTLDKAMTTGSVPSFLDMILNFAESDKSSSLEGQDTWLAQLKAKRDGRLVMFGDDTWLKLFPETFAHADGTSSFFVSRLRLEHQDFTEVDYNVTRNLPAQLDRDDWNGMILHYLGLDHIGHKTGPNRYTSARRHSTRTTALTEAQFLYDSKASRNGWHCE